MTTPDEDAPPAPPAGGFGAPAAGQTPEFVHHAAKPARASNVLHVVFIALGCFIALVVASGFLFARRKQRAARGAEARVMVHQISRGMQAAYTERHQLCPSARAIPADIESVRGAIYTSRAQEWRDDAGWSCAGFEMQFPQRYQYRVETEGVFVTITAVGDLDGDDVRSTYTLRGHVDPKTSTLVFEPSIEQSNDGE